MDIQVNPMEELPEIDQECLDCRNIFSAKQSRGFAGKAIAQGVCATCSSNREIESEKFRRRHNPTPEERKADRWLEICPENYRDTDPARLPQTALKIVMAWQPGGRGIVMGGHTGAMKTRTMYQLLERLHAEDRKIKIFNSVGFKTAATQAALDNKSDKWIDDLSKFDVLYFDDLGQMKLTENSAEALLSLIEARTCRKKPFFATTQFRGDGLVARFPYPESGQAFLRRLEEFCQIIPVP